MIVTSVLCKYGFKKEGKIMTTSGGNKYDYRSLRQLINANHDRFSELNYDNSLSLGQKMNAIIEWFKTMLKEYDAWVDYLDEFQANFDTNLYSTVDDILQKWIDDGVISEIIDGLFKFYRLSEITTDKFYELCANDEYVKIDIDTDLVIDTQNLILFRTDLYTLSKSIITVKNEKQIIFQNQVNFNDLRIKSENIVGEPLVIKKKTGTGKSYISIDGLTYSGTLFTNAWRLFADPTGVWGITMNNQVYENLDCLYMFDFPSSSAWINGNNFKNIQLDNYKRFVDYNGTSTWSYSANWAGNTFELVKSQASSNLKQIYNDIGQNIYIGNFNFDVHKPEFNGGDALESPRGIIKGSIIGEYIETYPSISANVILRNNGQYLRLGFFDNKEGNYTEQFLEFKVYNFSGCLGTVYLRRETNGNVVARSSTATLLDNFDIYYGTGNIGQFVYLKWLNSVWAKISYYERYQFYIEHSGGIYYTQDIEADTRFRKATKIKFSPSELLQLTVPTATYNATLDQTVFGSSSGAYCRILNDGTLSYLFNFTLIKTTNIGNTVIGTFPEEVRPPRWLTLDMINIGSQNKVIPALTIDTTGQIRILQQANSADGVQTATNYHATKMVRS